MNNIEDFKKHCLEEYPKEACGLIVDGTYVTLENIAENPIDFFALSEKDSYNIERLKVEGKELMLLHSHTFETFTIDPRTPSHRDMLCRASIDIPMGIAHCDGNDVSEILYFGTITDKEYLDRSYISNVFDCFTLARDFIWNTYKIDVGIHPRPAEWEDWNPKYIEDNFANLGFKPIEDSIQYGDILLFSIGSKYSNHIGIALDEETFLHHLSQRKSSKDSINKWKRQLRHIIRLEHATKTI